MSDTVADMTKEEFKEMLDALIEQKLIELFGDPEAGLAIQPALRQRLLRQREAVIAGERGQPLEDVARELGLG